MHLMTTVTFQQVVGIPIMKRMQLLNTPNAQGELSSLLVVGCIIRTRCMVHRTACYTNDTHQQRIGIIYVKCPYRMGDVHLQRAKDWHTYLGFLAEED